MGHIFALQPSCLKPWSTKICFLCFAVVIHRMNLTKNVKFCKKNLQIYFFGVYLQSQKIIGVWRSWLAHLVWDQRVLCSSHSTPTKRAVDFQLLFFLYIFDLATYIGPCIHENSLFYGYRWRKWSRIHENAQIYGYRSKTQSRIHENAPFYGCKVEM